MTIKKFTLEYMDDRYTDQEMVERAPGDFIAPGSTVYVDLDEIRPVLGTIINYISYAEGTHAEYIAALEEIKKLIKEA